LNKQTHDVYLVVTTPKETHHEFVYIITPLD